jgi:hypothetical protein
MRKPASLKTLLLQTVPGLAAAPERLALFTDKGKVRCRATGNLAFEYAYTLNVVIEDYTGDIDGIFVPLLAWIERNEPELMKRDPQEPFEFECEILDTDHADVSINIELTERVLLTPNEAGGLVAVHLPEPSFVDEFDGVGRPLLLRLLLGDDVVAEHQD